MYFKKWFTKQPATDPDLDASRLIEWSIRLASRHRDLRPDWSSGSMQCVALWHVMPVVVALKHHGIDPPLPNSMLDEIAPDITSAIGASLFGAQADDDELRAVMRGLSQCTRQFTVFWLTAFQEFSARRYFDDQPLLTKMLAGLIENPEYELTELLGLPDEDDVLQFADGLASYIKACHAQVSKLSLRSS